jgi:hypothetical protein
MIRGPQFNRKAYADRKLIKSTQIKLNLDKIYTKRGITSTGRTSTHKRGITSTLCWELSSQHKHIFVDMCGKQKVHVDICGEDFESKK